MRGKILMYGNVQLYQDDLQSCLVGNWLKDSIIEYQYERWELDEFKNFKEIAFVRPALVYLLQSTRSDVGLDLALKSLIFLPINNGIEDHSSGTHWSLLVYAKKFNSFFYYDSLGTCNLSTAKAIKDAISNIFPGNPGFSVVSTPQQSNGYDCGVYVIAITKILAHRFVDMDDLNADLFNEKLYSDSMIDLRNEIVRDIEMIARGN